MVGQNSFTQGWRTMQPEEVVHIRKGDLIKLAPRLQELFLLQATSSNDDYNRNIGSHPFGPPRSPPEGPQFIGNNPNRWRNRFSPPPQVSPELPISISPSVSIDQQSYLTNTTVPG